MRLLRIAPLLLVAVFAPVIAHATSMTIDVSAFTCYDCWCPPPVCTTPPALPNVSIHAQIRVEEGSGPHWDAFFGTYLTGTFLDVVSITGTLTVDGSGPYALSLVPTPNGPSWIEPSIPWFVYFAAEGFEPDLRIINDHPSTTLLQDLDSSSFAQLPLRWFASVVAVPEPPTVVLVGCAVLAAVGLGGASRYAHHGG